MIGGRGRVGEARLDHGHLGLAAGDGPEIERHTEAQWRRCELRGEGFRAATDWIEFYRRFWEQQFDKLDAFLKRTAPKAPKANPPKGKNNGRRR